MVTRPETPPDWARYWRATDRPLEAMHARFQRHAYHRHSHESYSLGVTDAGAQAFSCRGAARTSAAGMVMAFNPDDPHDGHTATTGGFVYRMVYIGPDLLAEVLGDGEGAPASRAAFPLFTEPVIDDPALARELRRLHAVLLGGSDMLTRDERLASVVLRAAGHTGHRARVAPDPGESTARVIVERARRWMDDRLDVDLGADRLAAAVGCSRYAVYRAFHTVCGMAPSDYRRQLRLRAARRLLDRGTPAGRAAVETGFADQAHLTRWFVRYYGVTPGCYAAARETPAPGWPSRTSVS